MKRLHAVFITLPAAKTVPPILPQPHPPPNQQVSPLVSNLETAPMYLTKVQITKAMMAMTNATKTTTILMTPVLTTQAPLLLIDTAAALVLVVPLMAILVMTTM